MTFFTEVAPSKSHGMLAKPLLRMKMHGVDSAQSARRPTKKVAGADLKSALDAFAAGDGDSVDLSTGIELLEAVRRAAEREGNLGAYTRATKLQQMFRNGIGDPDGRLTESLYQAGQF